MRCVESDRLGSFFGGISLHNEQMSDDQRTSASSEDVDDEDDFVMRDVDDSVEDVGANSAAKTTASSSSFTSPEDVPAVVEREFGHVGGTRGNTNRRRYSSYSLKPDSKHSRTTLSPFPKPKAPKPKAKAKTKESSSSSSRRRSTPYSGAVDQKHARTSLRRSGAGAAGASKGKKRRRTEEPNVGECFQRVLLGFFAQFWVQSVLDMYLCTKTVSSSREPTVVFLNCLCALLRRSGAGGASKGKKRRRMEEPNVGECFFCVCFMLVFFVCSFECGVFYFFK